MYKYIIVETTHWQTKLKSAYSIVFPEQLSHRDVASIHSASSERIVVSAGFIRLSGGKLECYGESESLRGMKSRPEDVDIITRDYGKLMNGIL